MEIGNYFLSLAALVPLVILITDFMVRWLKIEKGWFRQLTSWVVSSGLCFLAMAFNLGMFEGFSVAYTLGYALATGLVANGVFDIGLVQTLLDFVLKFIPKKE